MRILNFRRNSWSQVQPGPVDRVAVAHQFIPTPRTQVPLNLLAPMVPNGSNMYHLDNRSYTSVSSNNSHVRSHESDQWSSMTFFSDGTRSTSTTLTSHDSLHSGRILQYGIPRRSRTPRRSGILSPICNVKLGNIPWHKAPYDYGTALNDWLRPQVTGAVTFHFDLRLPMKWIRWPPNYPMPSLDAFATSTAEKSMLIVYPHLNASRKVQNRHGVTLRDVLIAISETMQEVVVNATFQAYCEETRMTLTRNWHRNCKEGFHSTQMIRHFDILGDQICFAGLEADPALVKYCLGKDIPKASVLKFATSRVARKSGHPTRYSIKISR